MGIDPATKQHSRMGIQTRPGRLWTPILRHGKIAAGLVFAATAGLVAAGMLLGSARAAEAKSPRSLTVNFGDPATRLISPDADKEDPKKTAPSASPSPDKPSAQTPTQTKPTLSPQLAALRDRVRTVVVQHFHDPLNTNDNSPSQILKFCLAFGCDTEIRYGSAAGNEMSGIGALCYNYPCAGYRLLAVEGGKPLARVGYGLQDSPGELLAMLAQSAVPESYEIRVGDWRGKVKDLVESEKLSCVPGVDLSQKLLGLSHYLHGDATWKNTRGEAWSLERIVREELNRSPASDSSDTTNHLVGLSYALECHIRAGRPVEGQYERAQKFLADFQTFAFSLQNSDGSWNPGFFASKGASRDASGSLRATGRILEWLAASLPADRLQDRQVVVSVAFVTGLLEGSFAQANVAYASPRDIDGLMHALHAVKLYDRRVFKPADPAKGEKPEKSQSPETQASTNRQEDGRTRR